MSSHAAPATAGEIGRIRLVLRMFSFLRHVRGTALIACAVVAFRVAAEVLAVAVLSPAVTIVAAASADPLPRGFGDWLTDPDPQGTPAQMRRVLLLMAGTQVLLGVAVYLRNVWDGTFSMRLVFFIREAVYDRLQRVGFSFHDRTTTGQLINRALSDLQHVRSFINLGLLATLDIVFYVGGYLVLLGLRSPWLALTALLPVPFWLLAVSRFARKAEPLYAAQQDAADRLMTGLTENVAGVHVVRAFGREADESARHEQLNQGLLARMFAVVGLQQRLTPVLRGIAVGSHIILVLVAVHLIRAGVAEIGDLLILGVASGTILAKLQQMGSVAEAYQRAIVSARRVFDVLDTPAAPAGRPGAPAPVLSEGRIEFDGVTFGYDPAKPVLRNLTACLPGRKMTAVVGPTGAGKSTLASLIGRFYDPQSGQVRIDGQDVRTVDLSSLRRSVGYVFQETYLFSDTVYNNIRYGRADVSEDMVRAAAEAAQAAEFIESLPQKYETLLGERGLTLSGGQRQRLALARALVYDPKILVLDDATAALDPETEQVVQMILDLLYADRTVVVITHRVSTVRRADYVLVLQDGRLTQAGTHAELIAQDGYYRAMVRMQAAPAGGGM